MPKKLSDDKKPLSKKEFHRILAKAAPPVKKISKE